MGYSRPIFNLEADAWGPGQTPIGFPPTWAEIPVQLYLASRAIGIDADYSWSTLWVPHLIIRFYDVDALGIFEGAWIWECPRLSGKWYRVAFKHLMHEGFLNEYHAHFVGQCTGAGIPVARDVIPYP